MQRKSIDSLVGLFVLLGLGALSFLVLKVANFGALSTGPVYHVVTKFDNIGGLKPQAPVKSSGVVVGRVGKISFDDKTFKAVVMLNLDEKYRFPIDSSVKIQTSGLLGEQFIAIDAGSDDSKVLAEGTTIKNTQSAVVLEDLIGQLIYSKATDGKDGGK